VAGQDPVAAVLEYATRRISLHPDIQVRLHHEIMTSLPNGNEEWTSAMVDALPFLNAIVLEGLRLVDTIGSYQRRVVPLGGCTIEGFYLPAGVSLGCGPRVRDKLFSEKLTVLLFTRPSCLPSRISSTARLPSLPTRKPSTQTAGSWIRIPTKFRTSLSGRSPADREDV
jgi:hypothetical protein